MCSEMTAEWGSHDQLATLTANGLMVSSSNVSEGWLAGARWPLRLQHLAQMNEISPVQPSARLTVLAPIVHSLTL